VGTGTGAGAGAGFFFVAAFLGAGFFAITLLATAGALAGAFLAAGFFATGFLATLAAGFFATGFLATLAAGFFAAGFFLATLAIVLFSMKGDTTAYDCVICTLIVNRKASCIANLIKIFSLSDFAIRRSGAIVTLAQTCHMETNSSEGKLAKQ
jgi:hypothetical protein